MSQLSVRQRRKLVRQTAASGVLEKTCSACPPCWPAVGARLAGAGVVPPGHGPRGVGCVTHPGVAGLNGGMRCLSGSDGSRSGGGGSGPAVVPPHRSSPMHGGKISSAPWPAQPTPTTGGRGQTGCTASGGPWRAARAGCTGQRTTHAYQWLVKLLIQRRALTGWRTTAWARRRSNAPAAAAAPRTQGWHLN